MKRQSSLLYFLLLGTLTSCQSNRDRCDEVICETVHRYGVPLEPDDWSSRGEDGQIVSMRTDGAMVTRTYDSGVLHGETTYTYPYLDVVQKREQYDQGNLVQEQYHYANGFPQRQVVYQSPNHQSETIWYENGAPHAYEQVENHQIISGKYYNRDQQLDSEIENGSGLRTRRDGQGALQSVDGIQEGKMVTRTTYHPNGMPAAVTPYVNGVIEGEKRTYLSGGEPATIETWKDNVQHGTTQVYEHGEMRADVPYEKGQKHGVERRYRGNDSNVVQEINWVKGQRHGPTQTYMGDTTKTDWYFRNRPIPNQSTFDMLSNQ